MIDKDKVLIGLGQHISGRTSERCGSCPYFFGDSGYGITCRDELLDDLYEMLEEQEPRVMTIDEVGTWAMIDRVDRAPIVVEVRDRFITWVVGDEYFDLPECNLSSEFYGKTWRCWNTKPSKEDMEAEPWET